MRYYVRCEFVGPTDIADPAFIEALEVAGLLRLVTTSPLCFTLAAPAHVSTGASGHWAGMVSARLQAMRDDWTVTVDREAEVN